MQAVIDVTAGELREDANVLDPTNKVRERIRRAQESSASRLYQTAANLKRIYQEIGSNRADGARRLGGGGPSADRINSLRAPSLIPYLEVIKHAIPSFDRLRDTLAEFECSAKRIAAGECDVHRRHGPRRRHKTWSTAQPFRIEERKGHINGR